MKNARLLSAIGLCICLCGARRSDAQEKKMTIDAPRHSFSFLEEKQRKTLIQKEEPTLARVAPVNAGFRQAASKAVPGVVRIIATYKPGLRATSINPFSRFYPDDLWPNSLEGTRGTEEGMASGVLLTSDGFIATNWHVVKNTSSINVVLYNQRSYKARILGVDSLTDLALLKITGLNLPFIPFGSSDSVAVGDWVLAIGNPFNLESTVTAGIVSAKSRRLNTLEEQGGLYSFIQTDAVVNDGSSGGALVDVYGRLIGINAGIVTSTGEFTGYAFAIPVEIVKKVSNDLLGYGFAQRAYMGAFVNDIPGGDGIAVDSLVSNGAAMQAGIREGDVIITMDGRRMGTVTAFHESMLQRRPGDKVTVSVLRKKKELKLQVILDSETETVEKVIQNDSGLLKLLGIEIKNLDDSEKDILKIDAGIRVIKVRNGKVYQFTNIEPGFIILEVNNHPITSRDQFIEILRHTRGRVLISGIYEDYPQALYYAAFNL